MRVHTRGNKRQQREHIDPYSGEDQESRTNKQKETANNSMPSKTEADSSEMESSQGGINSTSPKRHTVPAQSTSTKLLPSTHKPFM